MNLRVFLVSVACAAALGGCAGGNRSDDDLGSIGGGASDLGVGSDAHAPEGLRVVINEVNPNGPDEATDPDWVELVNLGTTTADLSGYQIWDSKKSDATPFPAGTELAPGGYLVIYCDDAVDGGVSGGVHVPFKLSGTKGDEVHFADPAGTELDSAVWAANVVGPGQTWARLPDGTGDFQPTSTPTRGSANQGGAVPAQDLAVPEDLSVASPSSDLSVATVHVVINEVNPNGPDVATDPDWIELINVGATTADVSGFTIRDSKLADATPMPDGTTIPPGGYLLILCDDAIDGGVLGGVHVPFKLSGSKGDEVHFADPNGTELDSAIWAKNVVGDGQTWARIPNGTGAFQASSTPTRGTANQP